MGRSERSKTNPSDVDLKKTQRPPSGLLLDIGAYFTKSCDCFTYLNQLLMEKTKIKLTLERGITCFDQGEHGSVNFDKCLALACP